MHILTAQAGFIGLVVSIYFAQVSHGFRLPPRDDSDLEVDVDFDDNASLDLNNLDDRFQFSASPPDRVHGEVESEDSNEERYGSANGPDEPMSPLDYVPTRRAQRGLQPQQQLNPEPRTPPSGSSTGYGNGSGGIDARIADDGLDDGLDDLLRPMESNSGRARVVRQESSPLMPVRQHTTPTKQSRPRPFRLFTPPDNVPTVNTIRPYGVRRQASHDSATSMEDDNGILGFSVTPSRAFANSMFLGGLTPPSRVGTPPRIGEVLWPAEDLDVDSSFESMNIDEIDDPLASAFGSRFNSPRPNTSPEMFNYESDSNLVPSFGRPNTQPGQLGPGFVWSSPTENNNNNNNMENRNQFTINSSARINNPVNIINDESDDKEVLDFDEDLFRTMPRVGSGRRVMTSPRRAHGISKLRNNRSPSAIDVEQSPNSLESKLQHHRQVHHQNHRHNPHLHHNQPHLEDDKLEQFLMESPEDHYNMEPVRINDLKDVTNTLVDLQCALYKDPLSDIPTTQLKSDVKKFISMTYSSTASKISQLIDTVKSRINENLNVPFDSIRYTIVSKDTKSTNSETLSSSGERRCVDIIDQTYHSLFPNFNGTRFSHVATIPPVSIVLPVDEDSDSKCSISPDYIDYRNHVSFAVYRFYIVEPKIVKEDIMDRAEFPLYRTATLSQYPTFNNNNFANNIQVINEMLETVKQFWDHGVIVNPEHFSECLIVSSYISMYVDIGKPDEFIDKASLLIDSDCISNNPVTIKESKNRRSITIKLMETFKTMMLKTDNNDDIIGWLSLLPQSYNVRNVEQFIELINGFIDLASQSEPSFLTIVYHPIWKDIRNIIDNGYPLSEYQSEEVKTSFKIGGDTRQFIYDFLENRSSSDNLLLVNTMIKKDLLNSGFNDYKVLDNEYSQNYDTFEISTPASYRLWFNLLMSTWKTIRDIDEEDAIVPTAMVEIKQSGNIVFAYKPLGDKISDTNQLKFDNLESVKSFYRFLNFLHGLNRKQINYIVPVDDKFIRKDSKGVFHFVMNPSSAVMNDINNPRSNIIKTLTNVDKKRFGLENYFFLYLRARGYLSKDNSIYFQDVHSWESSFTKNYLEKIIPNEIELSFIDEFFSSEGSIKGFHSIGEHPWWPIFMQNYEVYKNDGICNDKESNSYSIFCSNENVYRDESLANVPHEQVKLMKIPINDAEYAKTIIDKLLAIKRDGKMNFRSIKVVGSYNSSHNYELIVETVVQDEREINIDVGNYLTLVTDKIRMFRKYGIEYVAPIATVDGASVAPSALVISKYVFPAPVDDILQFAKDAKVPYTWDCKFEHTKMCLVNLDFNLVNKKTVLNNILSAKNFYRKGEKISVRQNKKLNLDIIDNNKDDENTFLNLDVDLLTLVDIIEGKININQMKTETKEIYNKAVYQITSIVGKNKPLTVSQYNGKGDESCGICYTDYDTTVPVVNFNGCGHNSCLECTKHLFSSEIEGCPSCRAPMSDLIMVDYEDVPEQIIAQIKEIINNDAYASISN